MLSIAVTKVTKPVRVRRYKNRLVLLIKHHRGDITLSETMSDVWFCYCYVVHGDPSGLRPSFVDFDSVSQVLFTWVFFYVFFLQVLCLSSYDFHKNKEGKG